MRLEDNEPGLRIVQLSANVATLLGVLFGTRHIDTTEHQDGMILAIAVESMVKLIAFVAVGLFVVFGMMGGIGPFLERATADPQVRGLFSGGLDGGQWLTLTLLAAFARGILCNALVCLAVWLCAGARSVTDKILAVLFPVTAFETDSGVLLKVCFGSS